MASRDVAIAFRLENRGIGRGIAAGSAFTAPSLASVINDHMKRLAIDCIDVIVHAALGAQIGGKDIGSRRRRVDSRGAEKTLVG